MILYLSHVYNLFIFKGFKVTYKAVCGGTKLINSNEIGDIRSPNYPNFANYDSVCDWILKSSNLQDHITLRFTHIESHTQEGCENYYIEVRDGDDSEAPLINRYCGTTIPLPITSQGNSLYISSIQSIVRASFATTISICGGDLISDEGYFASPVSYVSFFISKSLC
jgi:cubilin